MRHDPTPLHSAREREQLLSATRLLAILLLALALTLVGASDDDRSRLAVVWRRHRRSHRVMRIARLSRTLQPNSFPLVAHRARMPLDSAACARCVGNHSPGCRQSQPRRPSHDAALDPGEPTQPSCLHHRRHRQEHRGAHGSGARAELHRQRGTKSALTHYDPAPRTWGGPQRKERSHVARLIAAHHPHHCSARRFQRRFGGPGYGYGHRGNGAIWLLLLVLTNHI
jgi:hypothetical protein